jgi:hypothetical protein
VLHADPDRDRTCNPNEPASKRLLHQYRRPVINVVIAAAF